MGRIVLYMWMSLDGFIAGPEDGPGRGLGVGGERLHRTLSLDDGDPSTARSTDEVGSRILAEVKDTGAVLTGRRTFDHAGHWNGDHHDGVPIFVLTRSVPEQPAPGHARYVTDVHEAAAQARQAAGERDVLLHGASAARALLDAGELDEMSLQIMPVLLGQGRRLFDGMPAEHVELQLIRTLDSPDMLHTRYRIDSARPDRSRA
ncbi:MULTISPECIES: dihydrofolate reductase family protein [Prauserella salsuginis group]|uniref:Dihydrofolate reductase family protein n=1 Tax=Prauserella salsuginis TaxID=387889 RepID=A0ABW6FYX7_9PSEU|nr:MULTISPECIES: dihydrofolate reductase family protein [Prauserella salsuginis group]MCR3720981.1 Dihydrofolate reductase [Prauserella flava]MCR3734938.1 Dihydrofolate reductase [Prauserella salsuginis]